MKYTISRCTSLSFQNESTAAADGSMSTSLFTRSSLHFSEESTRVLNQSRRKTMGSTFGTLFSSSSSSAMVPVFSDRAGCASHPVHLLPLSLSLSRGDPLTPRNCLIWRRLVLTVAPVTSLPENGGGSAVRTGRRLARAPGAFLARSVDRYRRRSVARRVPPRPVATFSGRPATPGIHRLIGKRPSQSSEIVLGYFPPIAPQVPGP